MMMTIEAWLAIATTATALLIVPHPLASLAAAFSASWGRASAFVTVPATALSMALLGTIAATLSSGVAFYLPGLTDILSWVGMAYIMLYVLHAYQDPRLKHGLADNDNLPETRSWRILGYFVLTAFRQIRYIALLTAIFIQFAERGAMSQEQYLGKLAAVAGAAALSTLVYSMFPRQFARKRRRSSALGQASHKPRTLFIARRAVTAGYRRIAA
jgi:homoserine/homoserine lactone efflux protein